MQCTVGGHVTLESGAGVRADERDGLPVTVRRDRVEAVQAANLCWGVTARRQRFARSAVCGSVRRGHSFLAVPKRARLTGAEPDTGRTMALARCGSVGIRRRHQLRTLIQPGHALHNPSQRGGDRDGRLRGSKNLPGHRILSKRNTESGLRLGDSSLGGDKPVIPWCVHHREPSILKKFLHGPDARLGRGELLAKLRRGQKVAIAARSRGGHRQSRPLGCCFVTPPEIHANVHIVRT